MAKQYRNTHNGRLITIIEEEITDSGNMLYKCRDEATGKIDYAGGHSLKNHWLEVQPDFDQLTTVEEREALTMVEDREALEAHHAGLLQDAEFVVQSFTQADLINHIANLYAALDYERNKPNDACDTHSQTLITSDEEEEI